MQMLNVETSVFFNSFQQSQDPQMLDQLSKNITRCGLSNSTLNYLRVSSSYITPLKDQYENLFSLSALIFYLISDFINRKTVLSPIALCYPRAHARANVQTQDVQSQPTGLPENLSVSEMAEDGGPTR